jgi:hypothetical protein
MITIGHCPRSDGLQFFNPENGDFVLSINYTFQHHITAGSRFWLQISGGNIYYRLDESTTIYSPKFSLDTQVLVHTDSPPHVATVIALPTYEHPDIYTVKFKDGSVAEYSSLENLLELAPVSNLSSDPILLPYWIKRGSTTALFLHGTKILRTQFTTPKTYQIIGLLTLRERMVELQCS